MSSRINAHRVDHPPQRRPARASVRQRPGNRDALRRPARRRCRSSRSSHRRARGSRGRGRRPPHRGCPSSRRVSPQPVPDRRRSRATVASRGASAPETTKSMPATEIVCVVRDRQASTTDDAARSATSRIAPGPLSCAIASRSTPLASRATTRTSGLACRASRAISRFSASSSSAQMTACASAIPARGQSVWRLQRHDSRAGVVQLLDDPHPERIVTTHDDVPAHLQNATAEKPVATGEDGQHANQSEDLRQGLYQRRPHPRCSIRTCRSRPSSWRRRPLPRHGAGAKAVHMHPKTADGVDSLLPTARGRGGGCGPAGGTWPAARRDDGLLGAARRGRPATRRRRVDGAARLRVAELARAGQPGELAEVLLGKGLGVEVGIFHAEAAASWAASEIARHCMRVMIELQADGDVAIADDLLARCSPRARLRRCCCTASTKVVGHCWNTRVCAGVQTRIGMEDTLRLPDGSTHRTTPRWCRRRCSCSVGRSGQREVGEVETRHHDTADQSRARRHGAGRAASAPVGRRSAAAPRRDVGAEQMRCGAVLFGSDLAAAADRRGGRATVRRCARCATPTAGRA